MPEAALEGVRRSRGGWGGAPRARGLDLWRLVAALSLMAGLWGTLRQADRPGIPLPALEALGPLNRPLEVAGRRVESAPELVFQLQRLRPGDEVTLAGARGPLRLPPELTPAGLVLTVISCLFLAALLAFVVAPRAEQPGARALGRGLVCACLGIGLGGTYPATAPGDALLTVLHALAVTLMPVEFVLLALEFPRRAPWLRRPGRLALALRLLGLALAAAASAAWLRYDLRGEPETFRPVRALVAAQQALLLLGMGAGCLLLLRAARRDAPPTERAQARWLLWGISVSAAPLVLLRTLPRLLGVAEPPVPPEVDRLVELAAPAAFAIAVARHRLFDIDAVLRRSLIASVLALLLVGGILGVLLVAARCCPDPVPLPREAAYLLAGALAALALRPARAAAGRWVDAVFFRIRHEQARALRRLEADLEAAGALGEVEAAVRAALTAQLEPDPVSVWIDGAQDAPAPLPSEALAGLADGRLRARPDASTRADALPAPPPQAPAGTHLLQPCVGSGRVWAVLALGPRASGHRYVEEDLAFLAGVAERAARAAERLHLRRSLEAASRAREALAALDGTRREFLLRVAHDLRTPLTAVRWSAENLRDGVGGGLTATQEEQVADILAAGGRLGRLVENLVALSRLEMGEGGGAPERVEPASLLREVAASQRALARAKDVQVDLAAGEAPPVRARREGLAQVVQNLLDNAIRYAPPGSRVEAGAVLEPADAPGALPGGGVRLWVRDHGPGFGGRDPDALFGLFRQGPASPFASEKGFGVGLHVVRSWVSAFGGRVSAQEAPGGGALFTCRLPLWSAPGGSA